MIRDCQRDGRKRFNRRFEGVSKTMYGICSSYVNSRCGQRNEEIGLMEEYIVYSCSKIEFVCCHAQLSQDVSIGSFIHDLDVRDLVIVNI